MYVHVKEPWYIKKSDNGCCNPSLDSRKNSNDKKKRYSTKTNIFIYMLIRANDVNEHPIFPKFSL